MGSTQLVREQCRHLLHRPRIWTPAVTSHSSADSGLSTRRAFSQTSLALAEESSRIRQPKAPTRLRRQMYAWLNTRGRSLAEPYPGGTNYLGDYNPEWQRRDNRPVRDSAEEAEKEEDGEKEDSTQNGGRQQKQPFPNGRTFISEPVLSEKLKNRIYELVVKEGQSISAVSAELSVDMRRVAAVIRLKEVEKLWAKEGREFADAYANSVMKMLPKTELGGKTKHESINDLPVHPATHQQIFYPAAESRKITRSDAAKIFSPTLLPADKRVPHPELIQVGGIRNAQARAKEAEELREAAAKIRAAKQQKREAAEAARTTLVPGARWNFRFEAIDATAAGKDGRGQGGVGWRYGMPFEDRKRGHLKGVPTKVDV